MLSLHTFQKEKVYQVVLIQLLQSQAETKIKLSNIYKIERPYERAQIITDLLHSADAHFFPMLEW